jgi:parallel beta-helix repeat protein
VFKISQLLRGLRGDMRKIKGLLMCTLFMVGILTLTFNVAPVRAGGTVYIRSDGSVDPSTAPISTVDNVTYTFTDNIHDSIVVQRDNIVVDGAGYNVTSPTPGSGTGILLSGRTGVIVKKCEVTDFHTGFFLHSSTENTLKENSANDNTYGFRLISSTNNTLQKNTANNNINDGFFHSASSQNKLEGNTANGNTLGFGFFSSSNENTLKENTANNNTFGFGLQNSFGSILKENTANNNTNKGFNLASTSSNTLEGNTANNNTNSGFGLIFADENILKENTANNNYYGIYIPGSRKNQIYNNNFINNTFQTYVWTGYVNTWDNGYPSGGNYWSDYTDVDVYSGPHQNETGSDGIWDHPYIIGAGNIDNYPLVEPWSPKPQSPREALEEMVETIETWSLPEGIENSLKSKLEGVLRLLDKEIEIGAIRLLEAFINEVEVLSEKKLTITQADFLISEAHRIIDLIKR